MTLARYGGTCEASSLEHHFSTTANAYPPDRLCFPTTGRHSFTSSITTHCLYCSFIRQTIYSSCTRFTSQQWTEIAKGTGIEIAGLSFRKVSQQL
jgi:hypothetical protein